jgi:hypothetical protein
MDYSGVFFTGLSEQTNLSVIYRVILEVLPSPTDTTFQSLVSMGACYDANAFELYSNTIQHLRPFVPAYMNDIGDWFNMVKSAFKKGASLLVGGIARSGLPIASQIASGVESVLKEKKAKKKVKQKAVLALPHKAKN